MKDLEKLITRWNYCDRENLTDSEVKDIFVKGRNDSLGISKGENFYNYLIDNKELYKTIKRFRKEDLISYHGNIIRNLNDSFIQSEEKKEETMPNIVDLFCGAGGLSLGFTQENYKINFANDFDASAIETYRFNHPTVPDGHVIHDDINNILNNIKKFNRFDNVDLVIGGPPCQGFSNANRQRLIDDPRNSLYKSFVAAVQVLQPSFLVMENVRGMINVADQVVEDFLSIGYNVDFNLYKVQDFGVPQNRERLIFIGNRVGIDNKEIHAKIKSYSRKVDKFVLDDALFGLKELKASRKKNATNLENEEIGYLVDYNPSPPTNKFINTINNGLEVKQVLNHKARYNNDRDIEIFRRLEPGNDSTDPKIADIMPYKDRAHIFKDKYFKLEGTKISKAITAHMKFDCNMYIHPYQARGLTPREAARVQTFPDSYFFRGSYTKTYMQVGNSVPPLFARYIAKAIKHFI